MDYQIANQFLLPLAVGAVAFLYSSVGHGGATGYLAVAALVGLSPIYARPGALWMNCVVAGIAFWRFQLAGCFDAKIFLPLAATSVPFAWLGSQVNLSARAYGLVLAVVLFVVGWFLVGRKAEPADECRRSVNLPAAFLVGGLLGLLAGMTGIGGGVFLTPVLILLHWAPNKVAAGISALFIVVNSIAGLVGLGKAASVWQPVYGWAVILGIGGALLGTQLSLTRWQPRAFRRALAAVLWLAAGKLALAGK